MQQAVSELLAFPAAPTADVVAGVLAPVSTTPVPSSDAIISGASPFLRSLPHDPAPGACGNLHCRSVMVRERVWRRAACVGPPPPAHPVQVHVVPCAFAVAPSLFANGSCLCVAMQLSQQHGELARELLSVIQAVPMFPIIQHWVAAHRAPAAPTPPVLAQVERLVEMVKLTVSDACATCGATDCVTAESLSHSLIDLTVEHVLTVREMQASCCLALFVNSEPESF